MSSLFVRSISGKYLCVELNSNNEYDNLLLQISQKEGIPKEKLYLKQGKKILNEKEKIDKEKQIEVNLRLEGGKGGFGSLLRSSKFRSGVNHISKTACRDIHGRRLIHVNLPQKIANEKKEKQKKLLEKKAEDFLAKTGGYIVDETKYLHKRRLTKRRIADSVQFGLEKNVDQKIKRKKNKKQIKKKKDGLKFTETVISNGNLEKEKEKEIEKEKENEKEMKMKKKKKKKLKKKRKRK
ncbi:replication stress response regulator sde2 [Anaeramoeba ignava]|uniref:Replication stress response regulator sde2 n=1 Tax=Anaeramoeba ignava TaxID=1746090 RepID=A0A9Q0RAA4_ANAIG|nr:replication stress response regulator sde2 [Anaeramoeba ignava]